MILGHWALVVSAIIYFLLWDLKLKAFALYSFHLASGLLPFKTTRGKYFPRVTEGLEKKYKSNGNMPTFVNTFVHINGLQVQAHERRAGIKVKE